MKRVVVAFASREGQTEKIARHIALGLERRGYAVRLIDLASGETEAGADDCEGAIVLTSIHRGRYEQVLSSFLMRHGPALRQCPSAFVSVSLSAAAVDPKERVALDEIAQGFLHDVGWHPDVILHAAGAIHERDLGLIERYAVHRYVDEKHLALDQSGDTEFTDWHEVDSFIRTFADMVARASATDTG